MTATANPIVYTAHPKQVRFHRAVRRFDYTLFNGGRGSGKTTAGAIQAILEATRYQPGERGLIIAPTYPMLRDATQHEFMRLLPRALIAEYQKADKVLTLRNGSEIAFRSATDPDSLRGPNRAWAWFDEPRNLNGREAFDIVAAQLRPTKKAWLTTTPAGVFHWLYTLFVEAPLPKSRVVNVRTKENPHLPASYEGDLRAQYSEAFARQELDAAWVSFEGLVYPEFDLARHVHKVKYHPDWPLLWGVDDGYARGDGPGSASYHPRVILLGQVTPEGGLNILYELAQTGIADYQTSITSARALQPDTPITLALVDSSAAMFRGALHNAGISTLGATHKISEGIKNVRRLLADANGKTLLTIHPRCAGLIREMQMYRYADRAGAQGGERAPLKLDDHHVDALRYMAHYLRGSQ